MKAAFNNYTPWTAIQKKDFVLATLILLSSNMAHATALGLDGSNGHPSLAGHLSWLIDPTGQMTFKQALEQNNSGHFFSVKGEDVALGFLPNGAVWVHFSLNREASAPTVWWLAILLDTLDHIDLYIEQPDGSFGVKHGGRVFPLAQRELDWRAYAFQLDLKRQGVCNIYVRAASIGAFRIPFGLWVDKDFERYRTGENFSIGMFFGVMCVAFLLSAFRSLYYRSSLDGFNALYILGIETANFAMFGYFHQTGLSENFLLRAYLPSIGVALACIALIWFVLKLIVWPNLLIRRLNVIASIITITYVLIVILSMTVSPRILPMWIVSLSGLMVFVPLVATLWATRRGWQYGRLFIVAFFPHIVLALLIQAGSLGLVSGTWEFLNAYLLAAVFHVVLLFAVILNRDAELKRMKIELEWQISRLNEEMNHQSLFLRMLTHEVRTPLAIIDSNSQLLAMQNHENNSVAPQIAQIRASVAQLSELLNRCLSQDRLTSFNLFEPSPVDLGELITTVAAEVQSKTEDHLITCHAENLPKSITGDAGLLKIMLTNLLENAVHYSPDGGNIILTANIDMTGKILIDVCDEGVGIEEAALKSIFECYYRTQQVESAVGVGLGLYITKKIAQLHGGDIVCESVLGEGSRFRVTLTQDRSLGNGQHAPSHRYFE